MLSVLIETRDDEAQLARTLSSLIEAAVEGMVREVIVCDRGSTDQTHRVADQTGCHFLAEGGIEAGIRRARSHWLLFLEPGARLGGYWTEAVLAHTTDSRRPACLEPASGRLMARLMRWRRPLAYGMLITTSQAAALAQSKPSAVDMARGLWLRRINGQIYPRP